MADYLAWLVQMCLRSAPVCHALLILANYSLIFLNKVNVLKSLIHFGENLLEGLRLRVRSFFLKILLASDDVVTLLFEMLLIREVLALSCGFHAWSPLRLSTYKGWSLIVYIQAVWHNWQLGRV